MSENEISNEQAKEILLNREKQIKESQENSKIQHPDPNNPAYKSLGTIEQKKEPTSMPDVGWHPLPVSALPSAGKFYPDNSRIQIRAAANKEIRHFSTIDPDDPLDADDKLNFILDNCSIIMMDEKRVSYKDLLEIDRFYVIIAIRDS